MIQSRNWRKEALKRVNIVKKNTNDKEKCVIEKRKNKREIRQELKEDRPETPSFEDCYTRTTVDKLVGNVGQTKENKITWFCVQRWFVKGIRKNNPDWLVVDKGEVSEKKQTWWGIEEITCANKLLKHYGAEIVEKTVEWFCDNWQGIMDNSNGRLSGAPNVRLLWVSRDIFFVDAKLGYVPGRKKKKVKKHMVGEYDPELDGSTKVGW